ncbi:MAG: tRNA (adenosine(37)-N6)-threonylcarbamoyltransferase complex ATPase subunit type 1 TsaE [Acidobacteriaceae bacterium]|nr:tRNA (adenosine(37)-N6)-threonylcarbamoyltransferase complex ATPase subunit type 1 TsaE [Acidobacteriaceae bacterium]
MISARFETNSSEETLALGRHLASLLPQSAVVMLTGDLGAGKTTLTKGIAEGRGAVRAEEVSSPTFALIHEYGDPVSIYHIDLYRLETAEEADRLGLEELFDKPALILIEWGDKFPHLLPPRRIEITMTSGSDYQRFVEIVELAPPPATPQALML